MSFLKYFLVIIALSCLIAGTIQAQAVGDFGSKQTGNWGTNGSNWVVCTSPGTWAGAKDTTIAPTSSDNVWIRTLHTVTLEASGKTCRNLYVEIGGLLKGDVVLPTGTIRYLVVSGDTARFNGTFGGSPPGTNAALEVGVNHGTLAITGAGAFRPARVRMNSSVSSDTVVFDVNTMALLYTGSSGTGGVGLQSAPSDNNVFKINNGKTLTFAKKSSFSPSGGNNSPSIVNLTVNVYGTIDLSPDSCSLGLKANTGKTVTVHVFPGGSLSVGGDLLTSTVADGGTTALIIDGTCSVGGSVDFSKPSFVVTGTGSFTVTDTADLTLGHVGGISSSGSTGQIQTSTRSFSSKASYTYAGTAAQVTGSGLPSHVGGLTINDTLGVTLTNSVTVDTTLTFTYGNLITGGNTVTVRDSAVVDRTSGHVVGTLQKNVGTGTNVVKNFEVGTDTNYAPVSITFGTVSTGGTISAATTAGDHPNIGTSNIDATKSVNRYWTLTNSGTVFTQYDAVFHFVPSDVDVGAGPGLFIAQKYSGGLWTDLTEGDLHSTSTQILGATSFSDFAIGQASGAPSAPAFELSSGSLNFSGVTISTSKVDSVFIRNIGTATLNVTSIVSNNIRFGVVPASAANIAAGDSAKVTVTFSPLAAGADSAKIVFSHNAVGQPDTLPVRGMAVFESIVSNGTGGGAWDNANTWAGLVVPVSADSVVILSSDSVWVTADTSCRGLRVQSGGRLSIYDTLDVERATIYGSVIVHTDDGRFSVSDTATFENGSVYQHDQDGGRIPTAYWATGSTLRITGIISTNPSNGGQPFYNIEWNCPSQTSTSANLGWSPSASGEDSTFVVNGNITVLGTGTGRWNMCGPPAGTDDAHRTTSRVIIHGDVSVSDGAFTSNGTGNAYTDMIITSLGNIDVTGGNFSISRGSQGGGTGTATWYVGGDFSMSNATTQNSNGTEGQAKFVFNKAGIQTMTLGAGNTLTQLPFEVASGSTLNMGTSQVRGSGIVWVDSGATIQTANTGGIDSTFRASGSRIFSKEASYTFNGSLAQITGGLLPDTVKNLTINNASGATLSDSTTVIDTLKMTSGDLDLNGNVVVLGPSGLLSETSGNTVTGSSGFITTTRTLNAPSDAVNIAGLGVRIGSAANLGSTVISRGHASQVGGSVKRYFDITPTMNTGLNATLVFGYDASELNGQDVNALQLWKSTDAGSSWSLQTASNNPAQHTLTATGINSFSRWAVADSFHALSGPVREIMVNRGWNMISLAFTVADARKVALFPDAASRAFTYVNQYVARDTLRNGIGYWLKFSASDTVTFRGADRLSDTVTVRTGWNMIGSVSEPVLTSMIVSDPPGMITSNFFTYTNRYVTADTIMSGDGYWVKVQSDGVLILDATTTGAKQSNRIKIVPDGELPPPPPTGDELAATDEIPTVFSLSPNYPNPFNPTTKFRVGVPRTAVVDIVVYDILGRQVRTLAHGEMEAGFHTVEWNGQSDYHTNASSGVYFVRMQADDFTALRKLVLMK